MSDPWSDQRMQMSASDFSASRFFSLRASAYARIYIHLANWIVSIGLLTLFEKAVSLVEQVRTYFGLQKYRATMKEIDTFNVL
jgi:hypothetical protein